MSDATEIERDGAHIHHYIFGRYSGEGDGKYTAALEDEEGIARQNGQPELVFWDYEEYCASQQSDGSSEQFDGKVQVDVTT